MSTKIFSLLTLGLISESKVRLVGGAVAQTGDTHFVIDGTYFEWKHSGIKS